MTAPASLYKWRDTASPHSHVYLLPTLERIVASRNWSPGARALDFGCGNGAITSWLNSKGFEAAGIDISISGIEIAKTAYPHIPFSTDVSSHNIAQMGPFELILCIEVLPLCREPVIELGKIFKGLSPGGMLILATPYYGYFKNLALAVTGRLERHLTTLSSTRYVSFFSIKTIDQLLRQAGFDSIDIRRVGRISALAKVMVVTACRP